MMLWRLSINQETTPFISWRQLQIVSMMGVLQRTVQFDIVRLGTMFVSMFNLRSEQLLLENVFHCSGLLQTLILAKPLQDVEIESIADLELCSSQSDYGLRLVFRPQKLRTEIEKSRNAILVTSIKNSGFTVQNSL
jgi:hypothetical protein